MALFEHLVQDVFLTYGIPKTVNLTTSSYLVFSWGIMTDTRGIGAIISLSVRPFISRHVLFDEATFPFKESSLPSAGVTDFVVTTFQEWHSSTMPTVPETHAKALDDI